jgi:hypothetical protein
MKKSTWLVVVPAAFGLIASTLPACTIVTNETSTQCRSQQDCLDRGPEFVDTTCTTQRVCERIKVDEKACATNAECIDRAGGVPSICRKSDGRCVSLVNSFCQVVHADKSQLLDENLVYVGVTVPTVEIGRLADATTEMARQEINRAGGLAPATPGGPRRPIATITCSGEQLSPPLAAGQYKFLAEQAQVPFAIGPMVSGRVVPAANEYIPHGVLSMNSNSLVELSDVESKGLVYRAGFSEADEVKIYSDLLKDYLQPTLLASGQLAAGEAVRIAVIRDPGEGIGTTALISKTLVMNGANALDPANANNYKIFDGPDPNDPINYPNPEALAASVIQGLLALKPHVVLQTGALRQTLTLYPGFVNAWVRTMAGAPQPYWIVSIPSTSTVLPGILAGLKNDEARSKILGLRMFPFDFNPKDLGAFSQAFLLANPDLNSPLSLPAWTYYDSMYMFAYAAAAIGNANFTGPELSRGVLRVAGTGGGVPINWGPTDYSKALATLAGGGQIAYRGIIGTYTFNDKTIDHPGFVDLYCIPKVNGVPGPPTRTGYTYDPVAGMAKGSVVCPSM